MSMQINHPSLAMQAAQRMRKVKHKRKNSRVICHHLKMMLEAREPNLVQNKNTKGWLVLVPAIFFVQLPLISVILGSLRVRDASADSTSFNWSTAVWYEALQGSYYFPQISEALLN